MTYVLNKHVVLTVNLDTYDQIILTAAKERLYYVTFRPLVSILYLEGIW